MKKKYLIFILVFCLVLSFSLTCFVLIPAYKKYKEINEEEEYKEIIKNATIIVKLKDDLTASFYSEVTVSSFITELNGEIVDDFLIDTTKLGEYEVNFEYVNDDNIIIPYSYTINVVDDVAPSIWLGSSYSIDTTYDGDLLEDITCADNYDDDVECVIKGEYDTGKVGNYDLVFEATDSSGNVTTKNFTLKVSKPKSSSKSNKSSSSSKTKLEDVIKNYKTDNTKIGIDVSSWQGDIDYEKVKDAGVEFVFIRVGGTRGVNGEYYLDSKFKDNIEGFTSVGIPVGIYFNSYASSMSSAIADANWTLEQIKDYKVELPVAYDWENWSFYNSFHQSFYSTSMNAKYYLDTLDSSGYDGLLYSSKNYLEKVWYDIDYPVWLAHYTSKTTYEGEYSYWQLCSNGKVSGISGNVDIDIMYIN